MAVKVVKRAGQLVPNGTYDAVVHGIEEKRDGEKHYFLVFFRVLSGRQKDSVVSGLVWPSLREGSDLDRWVGAILGREIECGEELDLEGLLPGKTCRVEIDNVTKRGRRYSNVVNVLRGD